MSLRLKSAVKIGSWVVIPFWVIASMPTGMPMAAFSEPVDSGCYAIELENPYPGALRGSATFRMERAVSGSGASFSVMKLRLGNSGGESAHDIGFLITQSETAGGIAEGQYTMADHIEEFRNFSDGAFAYVHIPGFGNPLYFAREGQITISDLDEAHVRGTVAVSVENTDGESLILKGAFDAIRDTDAVGETPGR